MEKQERKSRLILLLAFFLTLTAIGLLAGAMSSDEWVYAEIQQLNRSPSPSPESSRAGADEPGYASHGLFKGKFVPPGNILRVQHSVDLTCNASTRICRYDAFDPRDGHLYYVESNSYASINLAEFCEKTSQATGILEHPGEPSFWLWISTVIFLSLAILFALFAAIATLVNVIYVPISDIAGIQGVYVWNAIASLSTLTTLCIWAGMYYSHLRYNILPVIVIGWGGTTCGLAYHGNAVWIILAALLIFILNIAVIRCRRGVSSVRHPGRAIYVKGHAKDGHDTTYY
ncbi:uncharacterized protein LOC129587672 [Paramacrobiotus metropolitanus]|uniref:uncharacterized protein LOC129587672 n=1 Tax=Paramacrobiotus metropolitanus TaxID=2943436 RepID=UPI002445F4E1|nr:uncharacterized protein LOC129587672 [Paramacrobiotus metropolitanus]